MIKAIQFAVIKHHGQLRKVSKKPYVTHPIEVGQLVSQYKVSKNIEPIIDAAILHDVLEDTDSTFIELATEFSPLVASLVLELTSDPKQLAAIGKNEYLKKKMLGMSSYALLIKLCDRLSNIKDNPTVKSVEETKEILEYLKNHRKLSTTHLKIISDIELILNKF